MLMFINISGSSKIISSSIICVCIVVVIIMCY